MCEQGGSVQGGTIVCVQGGRVAVCEHGGNIVCEQWCTV